MSNLLTVSSSDWREVGQRLFFEDEHGPNCLLARPVGTHPNGYTEFKYCTGNFHKRLGRWVSDAWLSSEDMEITHYLILVQ